jgi:hypothetical protein
MNDAKHVILESIINDGETKFMILIHARSKQHVKLSLYLTKYTLCHEGEGGEWIYRSTFS